MIDVDQDFWFSWAYCPRWTQYHNTWFHAHHVVPLTPRGTEVLCDGPVVVAEVEERPEDGLFGGDGVLY